MSSARPAQQPCRACQQPNDVTAEYCWACHLDLKPDAPVAPQPVTAARRDVVPMHVMPSEAEPPPPSLLRAVALLVASVLIVAGSWVLYTYRRPMPVGLFAAGWGIVLCVSLLCRKLLPAPPSDWRAYYSLNPFEYRDNWNRWLWSVRIWTFLPNVVLATLSVWRDLLFARRA